MGVQLAFTSDHGVVCNSGYHHITKFEYADQNSPTTTCTVDQYQTKTDYTNGNLPLQTVQFQFNVATTGKAGSVDFLTQSYNQLKTLTEVVSPTGVRKTQRYDQASDA